MDALASMDALACSITARLCLSATVTMKKRATATAAEASIHVKSKFCCRIDAADVDTNARMIRYAGIV